MTFDPRMRTGMCIRLIAHIISHLARVMFVHCTYRQTNTTEGLLSSSHKYTWLWKKSVYIAMKRAGCVGRPEKYRKWQPKYCCKHVGLMSLLKLHLALTLKMSCFSLVFYQKQWPWISVYSDGEWCSENVQKIQKKSFQNAKPLNLWDTCSAEQPECGARSFD